MGELERQARFFEGSWVGQFRAADNQQARIFAQRVADVMEEMGANDVGFAVREGSGQEFSDEEARVSIEDVVPQAVVHESVTHTELKLQLERAKERAEGGND